TEQADAGESGDSEAEEPEESDEGEDGGVSEQTGESEETSEVEQADESEEPEEKEEEDEEKSTREIFAELGFYDNEFTEFPPELSGLKRFKQEGNPDPIIEVLQLSKYNTNFMRLELIEALGRIGDEKAVEPLVDELKDADMRDEAMEALKRIGSPKATDSMVEYLDPERNVEPRVRA
ncbi:MAG: HEAT repeat domain-containing protein, partial [Halobacteria archaeon]|nr:HEAT repeat domain-containing protein [Halobacteria archaeon]